MAPPSTATLMPIADCHAHVIDPARFPLATGGPGYRPKPDEVGTAEQYVAVLDAHGARHALLVQPSGYGVDNAAALDAMRRFPGRFKTIAMVAEDTPERELRRLGDAGVVGVRFNLVAFERDGLTRAGAPRFLARLKALGWWAQVYADDAQWPEVAPVLRASGVRVLIDHFGVRNLAGGLRQPGVQAVLALGRDGNAAVKLSAAFRSATAPAFAEVDPYAAALLAAFGIERCIWGSDWPFIGVPRRPSYAEVLAPLARWLPDADDRARVLWHNPVRLFGFAHSVLEVP